MAMTIARADGSSSPTPEFLAQDKWVPESNGLGLHAQFALPAAYTIEMAGPGGMTCTGSFRVVGGGVQLQQGSTDHNGSVDCSPRTCQLVADSRSLFRTQKLDCGSFSVWRLFATVPAGQTRNIHGVQAMTMGFRNATLLAPMRVRARPSATAEAYSYQPAGAGPGSASKLWNSLPKGHTVIVIARALPEETISGKKAHWYFVNVNLHDDFAGESFTGWIFGGWMKL